jgi:SAM-dependent methyltransferase
MAPVAPPGYDRPPRPRGAARVGGGGGARSVAELAQGRFFDAYGASMDAALGAKVRDIEPWLVPGLVVDRGCGTGAFMRHLAARDRKVVGIEISDEFCREAAGVIQASVLEPVFADDFVANIVLSSVLHEVYSYAGYALEPVRACLANCARELRPGGRIVVRDIWAPEPDEPRRALAMDEETWAIFRDFVARSPRPVEAALDEERREARVSTRTAVEFLSKKDYRRHWDLEVAEVYTSVTIGALAAIAAGLGLAVAHAAPVRNDWIIENRWRRGVRGDLPEFTNQVVVFAR